MALVEALLDVIEAPGRIVFTSSGTHDEAMRTGTPRPLPVRARQRTTPAG